MKVFEVGKCYEASDGNYDPIRVLKRTKQFIFVENVNNGCKWRMKIRQGDSAEFAVDSSVPPRWRDIFTYSASWLYE